MTHHALQAHQATAHIEAPLYQEQDFWYQRSCPRHPTVPDEQLWEPTTKPEPLVRPLHSGPHGDSDDFVSVLVQERLGYVQALEFIGFNHDISVSILRYWITLKLSAPAGGPYNLLGVALAAIAELGEPGMHTCHGGIASREKKNKTPRPEWQFVFGQAFNHKALRSIRRGGVYQAPDFKKAKWLVYGIVVSRWEGLAERKDAIRAGRGVNNTLFLEDI